MKLSVSNPEFFFAFFYVLSFVVTFLLAVIFSIRLKLRLRSVLLMLTTVTLCIIVGSRLSTIPVSEWGQIISTGKFDSYHGRFAVGGLLFGIAGLLFSVKTLGLGKPVIDLYAWIAPIGFGIQKIGCFFNGCCYGKQTDLPWSVHYQFGSNAHFHQYVNGLISENTAYALGVHPVQLYETIGLFTIAFIVWRLQKVWKKTGSTLIFSICLFFIFRFFFEFLRDPSSANSNSFSIFGITMFQWFYLFTGIVCAVTLLLYEKRLKPIIQIRSNSEPDFEKSLTYVVVLSVCIYIFRGLFTPFELLSFYIKFIPAVFLTAWYVYKSFDTIRVQLAATSFFVLPLLLLAQAFPPDSTKSESIKDFYQVKSYQRIDIGMSSGIHNNTISFNPHEGECGTTYTTEDYKYIYRIAGAGYSSISKKGKLMTTTGLNVFGGIDKEMNLTNHWEKTNVLLGVNPYIKYDFNWVGIGAGFCMGKLRWVSTKPIDESSIQNGTQLSLISPEVYVRVGRHDIVDLKYNYGFNFPTSFPLPAHEISIGSGFGSKSEYSLRFGTALSTNYSSRFFSAEGLINKKIGLTVRYNFGNGNSRYSSDNIGDRRRILFGANYRFGFKK